MSARFSLTVGEVQSLCDGYTMNNMHAGTHHALYLVGKQMGDYLDHKYLTRGTTTTRTRNMGNKYFSKETLKQDASSAAVRIAVRQGTKLVKTPIAALMGRGLGAEDDPSLRKKIAELLEGEVGEMLCAGVAGAGLTAAQPEGAIGAALTKELRVRSLELGAGAIADVIREPFERVVREYLRGVPVISEPQALPEPGIDTLPTNSAAGVLDAAMQDEEPEAPPPPPPAFRRTRK
jgi:hypothetical protein